MRSSPLLIAGVAIPALYGTAIVASLLLNPDFPWLTQAPSDLGRAEMPFHWLYNLGLLAAGGCGLLAAIGLLKKTRRRNAFWARASSAALALASIGLIMAGLFPLPDPLHYGFGLTIAGVAVPLLGGIHLYKTGWKGPAVILFTSFALVLVLALSGVTPLAAGAMIMLSVALLCTFA
jgi:hypothetical membrane protein